jgi:uncharacterized protein
MTVEMRFTKWGGKPHWTFPAEPLGTDRYGRWLGTRAGVPLRRGLEPPVVLGYDFVVLVPDSGRWVASWNDARAERTAVYVDVTTEPVSRADAVEAVDLDLDVIRSFDGVVELLDEDEFAEHQRLYGYPPEVIAGALATADDLIAMITAREEPFGVVGEAWLADYAGR